jgi:hypothetical protein
MDMNTVIQNNNLKVANSSLPRITKKLLYTRVEVIIDKLNSFVIQDLRKLCEPERDSLTEAYDLLVHALSCINDASFYRKHEEDEEEEVRVCVSEKPDPFWNKGDTDFAEAVASSILQPEVQSSYTSEQKGEDVPEGTPIDNSNHTYFMGDERKFNWAIANAIKHVTGSNTVNYDNFYIITAGGYTIQIKRKEGI